MAHAYLSLTAFKTALGITDTTDDARLRRVLEAASRQVDDLTGRTFQPYSATRYFTYATPPLFVPDLLTVTTLNTLTTNSNGTRTYGDTWATTDYDLEPYDAPDEREPYTRIEMNPAGLFSFPSDRRGVEVVGVWGYWLDTLTSSATTAEALDTSETGVDVSDGAQFEALQTILIDAEQLYITAITANTLTVERGANGTTAAAHSTAAAISVYRYPGPVVEATELQATRLWRRGDAPFGVAGSPELGQVVAIPRGDPDVVTLLRRYRAWNAAVAR